MCNTVVAGRWTSTAGEQAQYSPSDESEDVKDDEVIADYKAEGSVSSEEPDAQKEKADCMTEHTNLKLPQVGTQEQHERHSDIYQNMQHEQAAWGPEIMALCL